MAARYCDAHPDAETGGGGLSEIYHLLSDCERQELSDHGIGPCEFSERIAIELEDPFYYLKRFWRWLTVRPSTADTLLALSRFDTGSE